jgi:hypothetical protein
MDLYSKVVLSVIAVALSGLVLQNAGVLSTMGHAGPVPRDGGPFRRWPKGPALLTQARRRSMELRKYQRAGQVGG